MEVMTSLRCARFLSETRCTPLEIRLVLEKSQVNLLQFLYTSYDLNVPLDIHMVADAEGNEMVLKLHRYPFWLHFTLPADYH